MTVDLSSIPETKQLPAVNHIDIVLNERGKQYGKFTGHALVTQALKEVIQTHIADQGYVTDSTPAYQMLSPDQREALDMIAHKIGRILNGNPNLADSWDDIAGYAKLVGDRLKGVSR